MIPLILPPAILTVSPAPPARLILTVPKGHPEALFEFFPEESGRVFATLLADIKPSNGPTLPKGSMAFGTTQDDGGIILEGVITPDNVLHPIAPLRLYPDGRVVQEPLDEKETVEPKPAAPPEPSKSVPPNRVAPTPATTDSGLQLPVDDFWVQIFATHARPVAERTVSRLAPHLGVHLRILETHSAPGRTLFKIQCGPYSTRSAANLERQRILNSARAEKINPIVTQGP